jgi:hypothetical protein
VGSKEAAYDDATVAGVETFLIAIVFVKEKRAGQGDRTRRQRRVCPLEAIAVAVVCQWYLLWEKGQVPFVCAEGAHEKHAPTGSVNVKSTFFCGQSISSYMFLVPTQHKETQLAVALTVWAT